jgi:hypothetical protein
MDRISDSRVVFHRRRYVASGNKSASNEVKADNVKHSEESLAPVMRGTNAKRPLSADHPLTAAAFLVVAYVGLYYATIHRPTCVARQYYA